VLVPDARSCTKQAPWRRSLAASATMLLATVGLVAASSVLHRQSVPVFTGDLRPVVDENVVPNAGDIDYAVPEGAWFVAPDGNDANDGRSVTTPVRTLGRAITLTKVSPGATIVLRGGTYREGSARRHRRGRTSSPTA